MRIVGRLQRHVGWWTERVLSMNNLPEDIRCELSGTEQVLWFGQPRQGVVVRGSDVFLIPFSLMWCGFAIFWEMSVLKAPNASGFFVFWGLPFIAVGVYMVVGRFFAESKQRSRTFYAVTSERILIVSGLFSRKVKSLSLRTLADLSIVESANSEGSISFGAGSPFSSMFASMPNWPGLEAHVGPRFDLISNAKSVFEIIRSAQRTSI